MARVLETRQLGGLAGAKLEKPALKLRSDLPASGFQSDGGMGTFRQGSANGGIPFSGEQDDYEGDWGDF